MVAVGEGIRPHRVHDPQRARLLGERVLQRAQLLTGMIGVRQRVGRVKDATIGVGVQ